MTQEVKLRRAQCNYQTENARFLVECDFSKQYAQYYKRRLEKTRPFLEFNAKAKWNPNIPIHKLEDLASLSSYDLDDEDLETLSPTSRAPSSPDAAKFATYQFKKRLRRISENSSQKTAINEYKTSTQKSDNDVETEVSTPTTSKNQTPVESPILNLEGVREFERLCEENNSSDAKPYECIVIGTIFKRMKLQPDVVEELSRGNFHVKCDRYLGTYTSVDDRLILEDTSESISLIGNIDPKRFVTGVVIALMGVPVDDGSRFLVWDICYAEPNRLLLYEDLPAPEIERHLEETKPVYLLVVSSLGFHQDMRKNANLIKALQNIIDFVWGGGQYEEDERCSQIARILVVGDNLQECRFAAEDEEDLSTDLIIKMKKSRQVKSFSGSIQAIKNMDDFFAQLSKTINIDVMPGASDPSSHLMPQQPFHPCMFPKSCVFSTFNCTTNPHHAIYNNDVELLATSGQNVDIISKFCDIKDPIEIMKCHLMWGNSAPSAPDNLYSAPHEDEDPYVIDFIPEIYLTGCQDSYRSEFYYYNSNKESTSSQMSDLNQIPAGATKGTNFTEDKASQSMHPSDTNRTYETKLVESLEGRKSRTLLLTVPRFCETFTCVLINLKNLETQSISFK